uniref:Uncharacterized protein n=1 Tax=Arion vulgaris TaxID=1028688 RepID=A0A0B7A4U1_9EUPU
MEVYPLNQTFRITQFEQEQQHPLFIGDTSLTPGFVDYLISHHSCTLLAV